jgi:hypothetical protein
METEASVSGAKPRERLMTMEEQGPQLGSEYDKALTEYYIASAAHRVEVLRAKIKDSYRPGEALASTSILSEILLRLLSCFFDDLESLHQEIDIHPAQDILREIQNINQANSMVMPILEQAIRMAALDTPITPIAEAYGEIANLVQYGAQTIIHPTWDYNASFDEIMHDLRSMAASLRQDRSQTILSGAPPSIVIITYPLAEQDMVLRQAIMAHEIGHSINMVEGLSQELVKRRVFDKTDRQRLEQAVEKQQRESDKEKLHRHAEKVADELAARWLREITADFLGLCVLGPAYLLAFDDVSFTRRGSTSGTLQRSHPPVHLRRAIMANLVEDVFLAPIHANDRFTSLGSEEREVFSTVCSWIHELSRCEPLAVAMIEGAPDMPAEVVQSIYVNLRNAMERVVLQLKRKHLGRLGHSKWFCTTTDLIDAIELQRLLSNGLIPTVLYSDVDRDPSFAAIMNCGWFHLLYARQDYQYFRRGEEKPYSDDVRDKYMSLQSLVGKAVESLLFKKEFLRRKGVSGDSKAR